jgi:16S rRNA (adenine1518-N6/adenine1519-N6)-dimethyltransferase
LSIPHVQTKREIRALLSDATVRPQRRFGQHFLVDGNLMRRLVASAELDPGDLILEVGGGTGGLTDLLVGRVGRIVCVEIDRKLHAILSERFGEADGVTLIRGDVLAGKNHISPEVAGVLSGHKAGPTGCVKLVANLPYQVATPLVMNLLVDYPEVRRLCFTVQAEVGERLTSPPKCKAYGPLSIVAQRLCKLEVIARVPREAFWPHPAVESVMIRMDVTDPPPANREAVRSFATLVRGTFDHRRKTLRSALGYVVDEAARERVCDRFDATRRPESFSVEEWFGIHAAVQG